MTSPKNKLTPEHMIFFHQVIDLISNYTPTTRFEELVSAFDWVKAEHLKDYYPLMLVFSAFSAKVMSSLGVVFDEKTFNSLFSKAMFKTLIDAKNLELVEDFKDTKNKEE